MVELYCMKGFNLVLLLFTCQYDPDVSPESPSYHGHPEVMLAYLKYQWSLGDELKRKEAFIGLQACCFFFF